MFSPFLSRRIACRYTLLAFAAGAFTSDYTGTLPAGKLNIPEIAEKRKKRSLTSVIRFVSYLKKGISR
jgi:hypothetical protein